MVTAATAPGQETVEVVHEALIRNWPALVDWVNRDRAFISWRNQLRQRLDDWHKAPSDEGTLLRGGPLAVAEEWVSRRGDDLSGEEKDFVARSVTLRDAEKRQAEEALRREQVRLRQAKWITAGVGLIVIATGALVSYQYYANRILDRYLTHVEVDVKKQLSYLQGEGVRQKKQIAELTIKENNIGTREEELASHLKINHVTIEEHVRELRKKHANLLGALSAAELARGNIDAALRLAAIGTKEELDLQLKSDAGSASTTALAAARSKAASRFAFSPGQEALLFEGLSHGGAGVVTAANGVVRIGDIPPATMSAWNLLDEVCQRHSITSSRLTRDEMRLAGYPDSDPLIDVCAGVTDARP